MIKKRLFAIVFLLFLPTALSLTEESLYTGTVHDGEIVSVDNFKFEFSVASEGGVLIKYNSQGIIVMEDSCKYKDNLHICVGDISFAYRNVTIWKDIYEATVDISVIKGELTITKTIEKTKLLIDETSKVEVFLENTGSKDIQNVVYKDTYPDSIGIKDVEGCTLKASSIEWKGNIPPSIIEKCSYTLVGLKADEYDSKAEASYFDGVSIENAYSDEVEIEIQNYSLKVEPYLNKNKLEIGDFVNLSIVLENINKDEKISVWSFKVDIPTNLKILKRVGLNKNKQILFWAGELESNDIKNFTVELQAVRTGNTPIYIEKEYKVGKFVRRFTEPLNIDIYCDCLLIDHEISDEIVSGKEINFKVSLSNPSYTNKFKDLKIDVFSNIPFADQIYNFYPSFDKRKFIMLYDYNIKVPEQGYYYNITISYKSDYGQYFKNSKNILIKEGIFEEIEEEEFIDEIEESELVNETTEAKIEEEETETKHAVENVTEKELETTFFKIEDKKSPLIFVSIVLIFLLTIGIIIGIIKIKKKKKEIEPPPKLEPTLLTFLFLIFAISLFFLVSTSSITGFVVYKPDILYIKNNLSVLGAMVVLLTFLFLIIYRKEAL